MYESSCKSSYILTSNKSFYKFLYTNHCKTISSNTNYYIQIILKRTLVGPQIKYKPITISPVCNTVPQPGKFP